MANIFILLLLIIISSFTLSGTAFASCIGLLSISEYKDMADVVVLGTVKNSFLNYYIFSVEKYYKGKGPKEIKVTGKESENAVTSIDYSLENNKTYLLFLNGSTAQVLKTSQCMGSREVNSKLSIKEVSSLGSSLPPESLKNKEFIAALALIIAVVLLIFGRAPH